MPLHSPAPVRAVLFDYGMVLSKAPSPAAWQRMKEVFGAEEDRFHSAYWQLRNDYDRGTLTGAAYWHEVARLLGHPLNNTEHQALIDTDIDLWTDPNQPMIDWAMQLRSAGMRTGILSNIGDEMERGILARFGWFSDFHHHTFSHRLLLVKPDPAIYAHAADGLGAPPENVLFIDDREDNIQAARAAGMQAIQYGTHEAFLRDMEAAGHGALLHPATIV